MKKYNIIILLLVLLGTTACHDVMDTKSKTDITSSDIWKEASLAEAYMFEIYFTFQDAGFSEEQQSSACDEAMFTHGREFRETNAGAVTETNIGWFSKTQSGHNWERLYTKMRGCNEFIENLDGATFPEANKIQLKGEAYFLRAYFLHRLTRAYGGVPIQLKVTQLNDAPESFLIPREAYTKCIQQVLSDLDVAAVQLKDRTFANTEKGRATLAAVKGLRTRVLADAASDLHDEATAKAKSSLLTSFPNKELLFYTEGSRTERWQAVKDAAWELMQNPLGHSIPTHGGAGLTVEEKSQKIWEHFTKDSPDHIFSRYFIETKGESGTSFAIHNGPSGYRAYGGNTPIQEFVDAFRMEDGSKFDWNNPQHSANPYKNREPRFYAFIMYDGMKWLPRPDSYHTYDPSGRIQTGAYQMKPTDARDKYHNGMDTRTGAGDTWNATYTGYYLKKFMNPNKGDHRLNGNNVFPFIRMTETYMLYIEACIELNELGEAKKYLNEIRENAGLPAVTTNVQNELRDIYRNESHKELCFEEHRYWNIRRWMIAPTQPGIISVQGIAVTANLKAGVPAQTLYAHDETRWDYTYKPFTVSQEKRQWLDKVYYLPIHRDEMNRNPNLIQNPGYLADK